MLQVQPQPTLTRDLIAASACTRVRQNECDSLPYALCRFPPTWLETFVVDSPNSSRLESLGREQCHFCDLPTPVIYGATHSETVGPIRFRLRCRGTDPPLSNPALLPLPLPPLQPMSRSHLAPLDGVRAIATLSLIASHTLTIATSLFPAEGEQWERLTKHPLFIFLSGGGGVHTDMFLVIGGLLLGLQQRASWRPDAPLPSFGDVGRSVLRRAVRLWPTLLAQCVIGIGFLGEATPAAKLPLVLLCLFTLTANYLPARIGGTFSCSPSWSVCVAFHCSVAFSLLLTLIRRGLLAARVSLLALFLASFAVRAALFDAKDYSLVRLGESRHFAYFQTGQAIKYIEDRYPPFKWRAPGLDPAAFGQFGAPGSPLAAYALRYFHRLYFVTHVRFGPFALGALLGLLLPERQGSQQQQQPAAAAAAGARQGMGAVVRWLLMVQFTLMSAGTLMSTMLPPPPTPDDTPPEAHAISTIGLHNMTALSVRNPPPVGSHRVALSRNWTFFL